MSQRAELMVLRGRPPLLRSWGSQGLNLDLLRVCMYIAADPIRITALLCYIWLPYGSAANCITVKPSLELDPLLRTVNHRGKE